MELYILRHAPAAPRGSQYKDDSLRPLTPEGKKTMNQIAKGMKTLDLSFSAIVSSPYVRATETAQIVKDVLNYPRKVVLSANLTPDSPYDLLIKEINRHYPKAKRVLIVGHEPHLSSLIAFLLSGQCTIPINFKKGGLCHLSFVGILMAKSAALEWLLTPSQLRQLR
jgi:phosphohistidine phosphatase